MADRPAEVVTDAAEHLGIIREVLRRQFAGDGKRDAYEAHLDAIERRAGDSHLYLAVIGEFCSGKSTFINALLRRRLLKAACSATTASITRVIHGEQLAVRATFVDDATVSASENDVAALRERVAQFHPVAAGAPLEDLLELLTSESTVANHVREVEVTVPGDALGTDVVILDTPGIGAGADEAAGHAALTESVMATLADCGVVLIPSAAAASHTLLDFLSIHARPFLHRCMFVITAVDRQTNEQRRQLHRYVRHELETKLGLADPLILESAAIVMIPEPDLPPDVDAAWVPWRPEFVKLETLLRQTLLRQRSVVIAERVARLLKNVIDDIGRDLAARQAELADAEQAHARTSVAAIEAVLRTLEEQAKQKISAAASAIRSHVASRKSVYRVETRRELDNKLRSTSWTADTYEGTIAPRVSSIIEHYGREYAAEADRELSKLRSAASRMRTEFARQFEENYRTLRALEMKISVPSISVAELSVPQVAFHQSRPYIAQQQATKRTGRNIGMIIGGIVGAPLGPVGIAIGAAIGRGAGGGVAGDDLAALQKQLETYMTADVSSYLDQYEAAITERIDDIATSVVKQFRAVSRRHLTEYGAAAAEMVRQHEVRRTKLARQIREARADASELASRAERLAALQQRLAAQGGSDD